MGRHDVCVCGNYAAVDVTIGVQNTVGDALNQSDIWTFIRATGGGGSKLPETVIISAKISIFVSKSTPSA
jgi:hypothetical protein